MVIKAIIGNDEYRVTNNYNISQQAGSVSSTNIVVRVVEGQAVPVSLQPVRLLDIDNNPFFYGIIQNVVSPGFSSGYEVKHYKLNILSSEVIFNNRLVSEAYENKYSHEIVADLYNKYISTEGVSLGAISDTNSQFYENYNCSFTKLFEVLRELADDSEASFFIDGTNKFQFLTRELFPSVSLPDRIKDLMVEEESSEIRTVQIVSGATGETVEQVDTLTWLLDATDALLAYPVSRMVKTTINGTKVNVGVKDVDDDNTDITFLYEYKNNTIFVNSAATIKPVEDDIVEISYFGFYDIIISNTNTTLKNEISTLNGTSGKIEHFFEDETVNNDTDANAKSLALLNQFSEKSQEISCICQDIDKSKIYNVWTFNFPNLNIVGEYVVCERNMSDFGETSVINVKLKSKNFYTEYGTSFKKKSKQVGKDVKVFKDTNIADSVSTSETLTIERSSGVIFYPTTGSDFIDPNLCTNGFLFYPL